MYRRSFVMSNFDKNTFLSVTFMLTWIAGLSLGIYADRFHGEAYRACLLLTPYQIPGFFGTMCINVLPLLISAYVVSSFPVLLFGICLIRAFLTGVAISCAAALYGTASFLMVLLLLFSLLLFGPVLLWYWTWGKEFEGMFHKCAIPCFGIAVIVSCLDRWLIAPLLWEIMNF